MDISQEVLIEVALNLVGYLAAGGLSIMVYRMFTRPSRPVETESNQTEPRLANEPPVRLDPVSDRISKSIEFINFGDSPSTTAAKPLSSIGMRPVVSRINRRDRADIIRIAREMMKAGATAEKIKGVIPISESELALLSIGNNS